MTTFVVGFARPDRWAWGKPTEPTCPWHAVEAHRPADELDGEVELAVCGAIVQVWGSRDWGRVAAGRSACESCRRLSGAVTGAAAAAPLSEPVSASGR